MGIRCCALCFDLYCRHLRFVCVSVCTFVCIVFMLSSALLLDFEFVLTCV